jgi:hypothetical protein
LHDLLFEGDQADEQEHDAYKKIVNGADTSAETHGFSGSGSEEDHG